MRLGTLRNFALALPHTDVVRQWGNHLVFKVAGKMFLLISLDEALVETVAFKCSPEDFRRLSEIDGIVPAPYLARASWIQVQDPGAFRPEELERHIRFSYELVRAGLPKKVRAALLIDPRPDEIKPTV